MAELFAWWRKGKPVRMRSTAHALPKISIIFKNVRHDRSSYEFTHNSVNVFAIGSILLPGRFELRPIFMKIVVVRKNNVKIFCSEFM